MGLYDKFTPPDLEEEAKRRQKLTAEMNAEEETDENEENEDGTEN